MAKIIDTDYLFLSTRVKALERNLLTRERMERMLEGRTAEDAAKVLQECGYGELSRVGQQELDKMIADQRHKTMEDLSSVAPDPRLIDVFKIKYDYHNIKVLLKAEAMGTDAARLLVEAGRVPTDQLADGMRTAELKGVSYTLRRAVSQAREVLSSTGDPQLADFVLDKAYFAEMFELARATGSSFLEGYVRISIDAANLRSLVRPKYLRLPLLRDLLAPAVTLAVLWLLPIDPMIKKVVVLYAALPCAGMLATYTIQFNPNPEARLEASSAILLSTLLSVATIPLWAAVLDRVF